MSLITRTYPVFNPIVLDDYPDDVGPLDETDVYQFNKSDVLLNCVIVTKDGSIFQSDERFGFQYVKENTYYAVPHLVMEVELFKGYDDIDYSGKLFTQATGNRDAQIYILKPGCYTVKGTADGIEVIKKQLVQVARVDVPYDPGEYAVTKDYFSSVFKKGYKAGNTIPLGSVKISYFVNSSGYVWNTNYEYPIVTFNDEGYITRLTGKARMASAKSGTVYLRDHLGTFNFEYEGDGVFSASGGTVEDAFFSGIQANYIWIECNSSSKYYTTSVVQLTRYTLTANVISYIQRVGGSQLFCYLEDGTVIPFQRSGKNLYGYGSMQLSGVDYGSYMEVSIDGGDSVVMDYWQKRGIYVPRGGDDG